jgi:hypothetical protein
MFFGPCPIFSDEGAGKNDKLAHDGGQGELGLFALGAKPGVEGFHVRVVGDGGNRRHVKGAPDMGASALDAAQALAVRGIGVEGNDARKRRGFCGWKLAKLGQAAGEGCRANKPDPLDGDENIVAAFQGGIVFDKRRDGLLQLRNHPLAGGELLLEKPLEKPAFSRTVTVLDRGFIGGDGLPGQDKFLKLRHGVCRDGRGPGAEAGAIKRQKPRVDLIGLGKLPALANSCGREGLTAATG